MHMSRLSILAAGLLAAAGVQAQTPPATPLDPAPGVQVYPSVEAAPRTRDQIRAETQGMGAAAATTSIPDRAGEASTMVRGVPNMNPEQPIYGTLYPRRVGVPATLPVDSPSVFEGGTPQ